MQRRKRSAQVQVFSATMTSVPGVTCPEAEVRDGSPSLSKSGVEFYEKGGIAQLRSTAALSFFKRGSFVPQ